MEDIAEAAGLTKGAVYYWFADKDDLGRDLQHDLYDRLTGLALEALDPEGDTVTNMRRAFRVYLDALGSLGVARFFSATPGPSPRSTRGVATTRRDAVAMVRGMLAAAIERGEVADLDPDALANVLLGAWAEATIHVLTTGERAPTVAVVDHLLGVPPQHTTIPGRGVAPWPLSEGVTMSHHPPWPPGPRPPHPPGDLPKDLAPNGPRVVTAGDGYWITDDQGRQLIDGFAGLWCVAVGHGGRRVMTPCRRRSRPSSTPRCSTVARTPGPSNWPSASRRCSRPSTA